ncbi:unnamed protein product, partial [Brassica oleracea var. botrytis]
WEPYLSLLLSNPPSFRQYSAHILQRLPLMFRNPTISTLIPTKIISTLLRTSPFPLRFANASIEMLQTHESAVCGAESDVMGLLLRL